jgi:hypothetical protein
LRDRARTQDGDDGDGDDERAYERLLAAVHGLPPL